MIDTIACCRCCRSLEKWNLVKGFTCLVESQNLFELISKQPLTDVLQNRCCSEFRYIHRKTAVLQSLFNKFGGFQVQLIERFQEYIQAVVCLYKLHGLMVKSAGQITGPPKSISFVLMITFQQFLQLCMLVAITCRRQNFYSYFFVFKFFRPKSNT